MTTLHEINERQLEQVLAQATKTLNCMFSDPTERLEAREYLKQRMRGQLDGKKPHIRSRVAHRLLTLEYRGLEQRLMLVLEGWND